MGRRLAALVLLALAAVSGGPEARAQDGGLCGIARLVDELLNCGDESSPATQSSNAPSADNAATSGETVAEAQPVHTVPTTARYAANLLLVAFSRQASSDDIAALLDEVDAELEHSIPAIGVHVIRMAPGRRDEVMARLDRSRLVVGVERSVVYERLATRPNDTVFSLQWGLERVGLPLAWDITTGSSKIIVAVLDSGVGSTHPDLAGAVLPGYDFVNEDDDATDDHGHGTAVAGIIAARTNNALGQAGVCWTCSILPVKVLGADGAGDTSRVVSGIVYAVDHGARVINLSLGGVGTTDTLEQAVSYARGRGVIVVAAAGNNASTEPFFPAASPGVLSVAATDEFDALYSWSNRGPWARLAAPGCDIATTLAGEYAHFCGTSAATPVVSGIVALALAARPDSSSSDIERAIDAAAAGAPTEGVVVGRVDASKTLAALEVAAPPAPVSQRSAIARSGRLSRLAPTRTYTLTTGGGRVDVTLTFTGANRLTLRLWPAHAPPVVITGRRPIRLERNVPAGPLRIVVSGPRAALRLTASYPRP